MARKPDMALFKTTFDSLARGRITAEILQNTAKQRIAPERPSKVAIGIVFRCHMT